MPPGSHPLRTRRSVTNAQSESFSCLVALLSRCGGRHPGVTDALGDALLVQPLQYQDGQAASDADLIAELSRGHARVRSQICLGLRTPCRQISPGDVNAVRQA